MQGPLATVEADASVDEIVDRADRRLERRRRRRCREAGRGRHPLRPARLPRARARLPAESDPIIYSTTARSTAFSRVVHVSTTDAITLPADVWTPRRALAPCTSESSSTHADAADASTRDRTQAQAHRDPRAGARRQRDRRARDRCAGSARCSSIRPPGSRRRSFSCSGAASAATTRTICSDCWTSASCSNGSRSSFRRNRCRRCCRACSAGRGYTGVWPQRVGEWLKANAAFKRYVLRELEQNGPMLSRQFDDRAKVRWPANGWAGDSQRRPDARVPVRARRNRNRRPGGEAAPVGSRRPLVRRRRAAPARRGRRLLRRATVPGPGGQAAEGHVGRA